VVELAEKFGPRHSTDRNLSGHCGKGEKTEGLLNTLSAVRDKLAASQTLGYSASGLVIGVVTM